MDIFKYLQEFNHYCTRKKDSIRFACDKHNVSWATIRGALLSILVCNNTSQLCYKNASEQWFQVTRTTQVAAQAWTNHTQ